MDNEIFVASRQSLGTEKMTSNQIGIFVGVLNLVFGFAQKKSLLVFMMYRKLTVTPRPKYEVGTEPVN